MKITKILYVLLLCLFACEPVEGVPDGASSSATHICRGNGYEVVYTIRANQVCEDNGYEVAYTIRGNQVCEGNGYAVAYTIR